MGLSREEYWSGLPFPPPGDLPDPGNKPMSLYISCISRQVPLPLVPTGKPKTNEWAHFLRCQRAGARKRRVTKAVSIASVPWEQFGRPQIWSLPLRPKLQDKQRNMSIQILCQFSSWTLYSNFQLNLKLWSIRVYPNWQVWMIWHIWLIVAHVDSCVRDRNWLFPTRNGCNLLFIIL